MDPESGSAPGPRELVIERLKDLHEHWAIRALEVGPSSSASWPCCGPRHGGLIDLPLDRRVTILSPQDLVEARLVWWIVVPVLVSLLAGLVRVRYEAVQDSPGTGAWIAGTLWRLLGVAVSGLFTVGFVFLVIGRPLAWLLIRLR